MATKKPNKVNPNTPVTIRVKPGQPKPTKIKLKPEKKERKYYT